GDGGASIIATPTLNPEGIRGQLSSNDCENSWRPNEEGTLPGMDHKLLCDVRSDMRVDIATRRETRTKLTTCAIGRADLVWPSFNSISALIAVLREARLLVACRENDVQPHREEEIHNQNRQR